MTTAPPRPARRATAPARTAHSANSAHTAPLSELRRLRVMPAPGRDRSAVDESGAPLVGYLVLVPEGTDPATLFAPGVAPGLAQTGIAPNPATGPARPAADPRTDPVRIDAVRIDAEQRVVQVDGRELDLTYLEFELLARLVGTPHRVHSRESLVSGVWGYGHVGDGRTVDVHVARLRRKLGAAHRHRIVTVRRVGYKYVPDEAGYV
ncbi:winged helix-turn-helix domain-containing protein [Streptomyces sp. NPDC002851]